MIVVVLVALFFISLGVYAFKTKKAFYPYWSNLYKLKPDEISDVKRYNRAYGRLLVGAGFYLVLIGISSFWIEDSAWVALSVLLTIFSAIAMIYGCFCISNKYKKTNGG